MTTTADGSLPAASFIAPVLGSDQYACPTSENYILISRPSCPTNGVHLTTAIDPVALQRFLTKAFSDIAAVFKKESKNHFRFVIRGAVAFGSIYHGRDIGKDGAKRLEENPIYKAAIFLGMPVIHAYQTEQQAAPFGLAIHHSAKAFLDQSEDQVWWRWFDENFDVEGFSSELSSYYVWCREKSAELKYDTVRIITHDALAAKYFKKG